jgi:hypothetical protein
MYTIDPDATGGDAPFVTYCDMTTTPVGGSKGGWTLVFIPASTNYNTATLDYTSYTATLLNHATEALIANRTAGLGVMGAVASFPLPDDWKTKAPFTATGTDVHLPVTITNPNLTGQTTTELLRYGFSNWSTDCAGVWDTASGWGRICVAATSAPFFNAFDAPDGDYCVPSDATAYDGMACSPGHMFTIAVR